MSGVISRLGAFPSGLAGMASAFGKALSMLLNEALIIGIQIACAATMGMTALAAKMYPGKDHGLLCVFCGKTIVDILTSSTPVGSIRSW